MVCKLHLQCLQQALNRLTDTLMQVLTVKQQALCVVKGFPYIADTARTLEVLAGTRR